MKTDIHTLNSTFLADIWTGIDLDKNSTTGYPITTGLGAELNTNGSIGPTTSLNFWNPDHSYNHGATIPWGLSGDGLHAEFSIPLSDFGAASNDFYVAWAYPGDRMPTTAYTVFEYAVPEPSTVMLFGLGAAVLWFRRRSQPRA